MSSTSSNKPTILVFSTAGIDGGLKKIREKATVVQGFYKKPGHASAVLKAHPDARAIWIADPDIVQSNYSDLSREVVNYARNGGTVVLGGYFSSLVRPDDMDRWMRVAWKLPWRTGQYHRTNVVFQAASAGRDKSQNWRDGLVAAYSLKASFLQHVAPEHAWYASMPGATSQSRVFGPVPVEAQTAVAFAPVGNGWVGYTGDVNNEEGTALAVLAMMGLNVEDEEEQWPLNPALALMRQTGASEVSISAAGVDVDF